MSESRDRQLDHFLGGELSAEEQRALAQEALDDPELFDALLTTAAIKAAAARKAQEQEDEREQAQVHAQRFNRKRVVWTVAGLAAAAAIVAFVALNRTPSMSGPSRTADAGASEPPAAVAVVQPPRVAFQPLLLSARLDELAGRSTAEFRSPASESRSPKAEGVIVSIEDAQVTVDLGSLDGLTKGSELQIFRGAGHATPIGRVTIATVFRERARGAAPAGLQTGDRVEVSEATQLSALLDQMLARIAASDTNAARALATRAVAIAETATGTQAADIMNELGAVLVTSEDYPNAEKILRRAQMHATGTTAVRVASNLASLLALRGDLAGAESLYQSALSMSAVQESDRRSIEKNLQDLRAAR